jgi:hypothetical protein
VTFFALAALRLHTALALALQAQAARQPRSARQQLLQLRHCDALHTWLAFSGFLRTCSWLYALRSYVQLALASHGKMARRPLPTSGRLLMLQLRSLSVTFSANEALRPPTRLELASRGEALSVTFFALDVLRSHTRLALAWHG